MTKEDESQMIRIDLTQDQQDTVRAATNKAANAIELTVRELEDRIAPRIAGNHNETLLLD